MDFFKQFWVEVVAVVMLIIGIVLLALAGFTQVEVAPVIDCVWVVLDVVVNLILAIKKLLQKKATRNK